jgi:hypothetical protein
MRRLPPSRMPRIALRIAMGTLASSVMRTVSPMSFLLSCMGGDAAAIHHGLCVGCS